MGRLIINIFDHGAEILNYFRNNQYQKNKIGLKNAITDWMDNEFYTTDRKTIDIFLNEYEKYINND